MKTFLLILTLLLSIFVSAQTKSKALTKTLELKMPNTSDDDMPGTRGASVVWHPILKKYYAVMAGNSAFPMAIYDAKGNCLSTNDKLAAMIDTRGLWYNPNTKLICGNGYNNNGWFHYNLNAAGKVTGYDYILEDSMHQPGEQCVGVYNKTAKQVLFLLGSTVYMYNEKGVEVKKLILHIGRKKADGIANTEDGDIIPDEYNTTSLVYTGIAGQEIGLYNIDQKKIELYDSKTGFMTNILNLPSNIYIDEEKSFGFAFANGMYWIFDKDNRIWKGYK
jgi:hypothetical protein